MKLTTLLFTKCFVEPPRIATVSFLTQLKDATLLSMISDYTSLLNFKSKIISFVRPSPHVFFGIHDQFGIRCIFQLRLKLSPLKYHKICYNFDDTPSAMCQCQTGIEDTTHFLFRCPKVFRQRILLQYILLQMSCKYRVYQKKCIHTCYYFSVHPIRVSFMKCCFICSQYPNLNTPGIREQNDEIENARRNIFEVTIDDVCRSVVRNDRL